MTQAKTCSRCEKFLSADRFYRDSDSSDGLSEYCKKCYIELEPKKTCSRCGETKPISSFAKESNSSDGFGVWCKACKSDYRKGYYKANRKKELQRMFINNYGVGYVYKKFLLASQGCECPICKKPLDINDNANTVLDHSHKTGAIRGVLCRGCNTYIGRKGDTAYSIKREINELGSNPKLKRAYRYLESNQ